MKHKRKKKTSELRTAFEVLSGEMKFFKSDNGEFKRHLINTVISDCEEKQLPYDYMMSCTVHLSENDLERRGELKTLQELERVGFIVIADDDPDTDADFYLLPREVIDTVRFYRLLRS